MDIKQFEEIIVTRRVHAGHDQALILINCIDRVQQVVVHMENFQTEIEQEKC